MVIWHDDQQFGIRTRDRINVSMTSANGCGDAAAGPSSWIAVERRARVRSEDPAEAFHRSQRIAALQQFGAMSGGGIRAAAPGCHVRSVRGQSDV